MQQPDGSNSAADHCQDVSIVFKLFPSVVSSVGFGFWFVILQWFKNMPLSVKHTLFMCVCVCVSECLSEFRAHHFGFYCHGFFHGKYQEG